MCPEVVAGVFEGLARHSPQVREAFCMYHISHEISLELSLHRTSPDALIVKLQTVKIL